MAEMTFIAKITDRNGWVWTTRYYDMDHSQVYADARERFEQDFQVKKVEIFEHANTDVLPWDAQPTSWWTYEDVERSCQV